MDNAETPDDKVYTLPQQKKVKDFYESNNCQITIAGIIVLNFLITCCNKQIDPHDEKYPDLWFVIATIFNIVFTIELIMNLYGRWWCEFWSNGWNRFDFFVVAIGILDMCWRDMPPSMRLIRMLRAFRVFRLFNRVKSMKKIIESILKAVPGVLNAFLINFILICIYAVLSVDFFRDLYNDCKDNATGPDCKTTPRGKCWGLEYYGDFNKALYTMFQVLTGESWSEMAARPALAYYEEHGPSYYLVITYLFFFSFVMINSFVLLNVVVAVLMDGMSEDTEKVDLEGEIVGLQERMNSQSKTIDAIMGEITKLTAERNGCRTAPKDKDM